MFAGRQFFFWPIGSIYARALISRGVARLLCRNVIDQVFIKVLPPPKAAKAALLGCPWQGLRHLFLQLRRSISQRRCHIGCF